MQDFDEHENNEIYFQTQNLIEKYFESAEDDNNENKEKMETFTFPVSSPIPKEKFNF